MISPAGESRLCTSMPCKRRPYEGTLQLASRHRGGGVLPMYARLICGHGKGGENGQATFLPPQMNVFFNGMAAC